LTLIVTDHSNIGHTTMPEALISHYSTYIHTHTHMPVHIHTYTLNHAYINTYIMGTHIYIHT